MIYLFNRDQSLYMDYPIIDEADIKAMPERRRIKGIWTSSAEVRVKGIYKHVSNVEYIGFYDADEKFQLYKIVDLNVNNDFFIVDTVYIFHDEAYAGEVIRDRRFIDRQADAAAIAAFEPIGWVLDGHDFTDERTTNFYYLSPLEALGRIEEVWGVEFNFWIVFDGQKILGKYYEMRKQIGKVSNAVYEYEENIKSITHTENRQDIITAVLPRGRGEELEEGTFGRSIQIDDVVWRKSNGDPLDKPAGQDYLEIPEMTALWGYDGVKPRIRKVDFNNEEEPENLIQLAYEWLLENSVPKSVFKLTVAEGQSHKIGDTVAVSYKQIGLTSYTRVFEVEHDHKTGRVIVEFGDVELKSDRRINAIRNDIDRIESNNSRIVELQQAFNSQFDAKVRDMEQHYDQALIDAQAEIEAIDERMSTEIANEIASFESEFNAEVQAAKDLAAQQIADTEQRINTTIDTTRTEMEQDYNAEVQAAKDLAAQQIADTEQRIDTTINTTRTEMEDAFNAEVQAAKDLAEQQITETEQRINTTINTTRDEMENDFDTAVSEAREYAEQQAEQHANAVDSKLETMRDTHVGLIQQNTDNIADVNDFIGDKTVGLNERLQNVRIDFEEKLSNISSWHYNLLRGTRFDEDRWQPLSGSFIFDEEDVNYYNFDHTASSANFPQVVTTSTVTLEANTTYIISWDYQSDSVTHIERVWLATDAGTPILDLTGEDSDLVEESSMDILLGQFFRRYWIKFTPTETVDGFIRIGTNLNNNPSGRGSLKIRLPYLTTSDRTEWMFHHMDNTQNLEEVTRRVTELEEGWETLITRTEYDFDTNEIRGTIRSIEDTVDGYSSTITNHENWMTTNGSNVLQTVDEVSSKVWLSDIMNPNMLPFNDVTEHYDKWDNLLSFGWVLDNEWLRIRSSSTNTNSYFGVYSFPLTLIEGETYTVSFEAFEHPNDNTSGIMDYLFMTGNDFTNIGLSGNKTRTPVSSVAGTTTYLYQSTFVARATSDIARLLIGTRRPDTTSQSTFYFKEPKLEVGDRATPYYTAFSGLTQRVDEIGLFVQDIEGDLVRQSDITVSPSSVRIGSTEILGDDVLASVLNVSPSAIDMITQKMRLSGDLYVDGDITSLAISAVEGNFANLLASNIDSVSINAGNITTGTLNAYRLAVNSVLVDRLFGYSVFANEVTARTISAVEGNFANLIVANLETNKLRARHINVNAIGAEHLWIDNALINKLSASTLFTNMLTANAVDAIEGNFARLFASEISTVNLSASNITTGTLASARLRVDNALINRLVANSILTGEMTSRSVTAINANFGTLFASAISTVDLNADNIKSGTLSSTRLQVNNALINRLISNSILTGEMRSQSITAVRGDIADLRTRILTSDVITSNHISVNNALIDKMFATSALISRLTSKSAFISQLQTIDLAADQVRVGFNGISSNVTINSSGVTIRNGALTVHRTDNGAPTIISGSNPNGVHLVASTPNRRDSGFTTQGQYAVRPAGSSYMIYDFYMFEWFYSDLMLDFAILNTTSSEIRVRMHVRGTDGSTFSREVDYTIPANTAIFPRMIVNLGVPDGSTQRFFIEARNVGGSSYLGSFGIHTYMVKHLDNGNDYPRLEFS